MARWGLAAVALWACSLSFAQSNVNPDFYYGSVIESFRKHDPEMVQFSLLYKGQASEELDVILVRGGRTAKTRPYSTIRTFSAGDLVGLFLVSRSDPALAYEIVVDATFCARCAEELIVDSVSDASVIIHGEGAYGIASPRRKYAYDVRSKRLLYQTDIAGGLPYLALENGHPVFWGEVWRARERRESAGTVAFTPEASTFRQVDSRYRAPGYPQDQSLLSLAPGAPCVLMEKTRDFPERFMNCEGSQGAEILEAPRANPDLFEAKRPDAFSRGGGRDTEDFNETIGPYQLDGNLLWFGLTFYDGEGSRGIGGFGAFNLSTRLFEMTYPPELADWSVGALLVEPAAIWLSLVRRPEGAGYSGGVVKWDRATNSIRGRYESPVVTGIARVGERLYLATDEGAAIFENGELTRYLLDVDRDGSYSLVRREQR